MITFIINYNMNDSLNTSKAMIIPENSNTNVEETGKQIIGNQLEVVFDFSVGTGKILETFSQIGQEM